MIKIKTIIDKLLGKSEIIEQDITNDISLNSEEERSFPAVELDLDYEYFAFISYQSKDKENASWLQRQLEHYKLPTSVLEKHPSFSEGIRPVFRDEADLDSGDLPIVLGNALKQSKYLIVICSPNSAKSKWVNKEVKAFVDCGKSSCIIPYIISGTPYSGDKYECYVPELKRLRGTENERLGIDAQKSSKDFACIKVISFMLGLKFDTLWQRYEKEKEEERLKLIETNNRIVRNQARFISEKVKDLVKDGDSYTARLVAMQILPTENNQDFPYTLEAESAIRMAHHHNSAILRGHNNWIFACCISNNNQIIASGSNEGEIKLWNINTGKCIKSFRPLSTDWSITCLCFTNDDKQLFIGGDNNILIYNIVEETVERKYIGHTNHISHFVISNDNTLLVTTSYDNTIRIWDLRTGACTYVFSKHRDHINKCDISPDNRTIISSDNKQVYLWRRDSGEIIHKINVVSVNHVRFSHKGDKFVICNFEGNIQLYNTDSGEEILKLDIDKSTIDKFKSVEMTIFSHNDNYLISADSQHCIKIWDSKTGRLCDVLSGHFSPVNVVVATKDEKRLVTASRDCTIRLFDVDFESYTKSGYLPSISRVLYLNEDTIIASCWDGTIKCYDRESLICKKTLFTDSMVLDIALSYDKNILSAVLNDQRICIWNTQTWDLLYTHQYFGHTTKTASLSKNGKYFVNAERNDIFVRNIETGKTERCLHGHNSVVEWVEYSKSGLYIVSCSMDKSVIVWDANTGKLHQKLLGHTATVNHATFNRDGSLIASASSDYTVRIWDVEKGKEKLILKGHKHIVTFVAFSQNGNYLVSASNDIRIWDTNTGILLDCLEIHKDMTLSVSFNNDSNRILSSSGDGTFKEIVFMHLANIIQEISERFKDRQLTETERHDYYL